MNQQANLQEYKQKDKLSYTLMKTYLLSMMAYHMLLKNYLHMLKMLPIEVRLQMLIRNMIPLRTNDMGFLRILLFLVLMVGVACSDLFEFLIEMGFDLFEGFVFGNLLLAFFYIFF